MIKSSDQTVRKLLQLAMMLALLMLPVQAWSQVLWSPATFLPSNPTSSDRIRATFEVSSVCFGALPDTSTQVTGSVVRTTVISHGCVLGPPAGFSIAIVGLGPLPANTYTYEIYYKNFDNTVEFRSSQPLVVAPSSIPALAPRWLLLLAASLVLIAFAGLKAT